MSITWPVCSESRTSMDLRATSIDGSKDPSSSTPKALVLIGVLVRSGFTQLTLTPCSAHSSASACVKLTTAALADEYKEYPERPLVYDDDVNNRSAPLDSRRCGKNSWEIKIGAK